MSLVAASCSQPQQVAMSCTGVDLPSQRLFLQQLSDTSVIFKWRGEAERVCVGQDPDSLNLEVFAQEEDGHKIARIEGLKADTVYHYSVGGAPEAAPGFMFRTAPRTGQLPQDGNIRLWLLGDSGTATEVDREGNPEYPGQAEAVRDGFMKYNEAVTDKHIDAILLLGDNAYPAGTDAEWQGAYFDIYGDIIRSAVTLPTIGNHEMGVGMMNVCTFYPLPDCDKGEVVLPIGGASMNSDADSYDSDGSGTDQGGLPYLSIFTLPTRGEMGGAPSGTEQYYSSDFGNLHIVSLDSQLSNADDDLRSAMREWLIADLQSSQQDWNIVIFHHPTLSKGENHDSDLEQREIDMRVTFAPIFEEYGVDAVYSGHAHSYERSWYLRGHYGMSNTFDPKLHAALDATGSPAFGGEDRPYDQENRLVYTVAGSSGKVNTWSPCRPEQFMSNGQAFGCTMDNWLMHPAHRTFDIVADDYRVHGIARLGSVVIDATRDTLTSRFVDVGGVVLDTFVIRR